MPEQKKGLILAGGGAKGSYQIGVWQALNELGWRPDIITGTSIGSLNGAMFVLDAAETARAMWRSIYSKDIMQLPEEEQSLSELRTFLRDVVKAGGLDVTPMEEIIDLVLDEDALRNSPIDFGLVTVELRGGLTRKQLPLCEIPQGKVKDYLLASAACFPALRPREIDGNIYLDGGYQDVMPHQLAIEMGATELICVDIDGVGIIRKNPLKDTTTLIASHWDLGDMLVLNPERAERNIEIGYYDTLRTFGKVRGTAYAVSPSVSDIEIARFRVKYDRLLLACVKYNPSLALAELGALTLFSASDKDLAPLEIAAETAEISPTTLYTFSSLQAAFLQQYNPEDAERFDRLWSEIRPAVSALAGLKPNDFVSALVYFALTQTKPEEVPSDANI
ncbi:MAG: patatin-like phospholipase family protein [Faecalibacterium sp.]